MTESPVFLSVRRLGELVRARAISPVALAEAFLDRLEQLGPRYNAVVTVTRERAMAGGERIFEVLDTPPRIQDKPDALELDEVEGRVDFEDVTFHYHETVPILRGITLHVEPGETIAFVGPTGAGKTTITSLISRGYEVTGGSIKVDGHDIRDVKRRSLTRHMGVVLQNPYLFSGTVRENIAYGRPEATDEQVRSAATAMKRRFGRPSGTSRGGPIEAIAD